ncbi:hypothetical protein BYT27DRAFT_7253086 [Phlegmacium glaucopus]|nr:hypothetical protein BYT27DRAFT_7253086 [Phlegmacium glaucopus]
MINVIATTSVLIDRQVTLSSKPSFHWHLCTGNVTTPDTPTPREVPSQAQINLLNIILINTEEYRISQGPGQTVKLNKNGRYDGHWQVLLSWKMIVKVGLYEWNTATEKERQDRDDNIYL